MTDIEDARPWGALLRHFADLRDGTHTGASSRSSKVDVFSREVELLDPIAREALSELNDTLLLGAGAIHASGFVEKPGGDAHARWILTWPGQHAAGIPPVTLDAHFERGFHHPHIKGATVGDWPLNVKDANEAAELLPTLRSIIAADVHNLVFAADFRIIPATMAGQP